MPRLPHPIELKKKGFLFDESRTFATKRAAEKEAEAWEDTCQAEASIGFDAAHGYAVGLRVPRGGKRE